MNLVLGNTHIIGDMGDFFGDLAIDDGKISALGHPGAFRHEHSWLNLESKIVLPGFIDPHCHFRDPNPLEEEDFGTGTQSAAAGGITTVLEQPVDLPPTVDQESLQLKKDSIAKKAYVDYGLWGGLIPGNIDKLDELHREGVFAFKGFLCASDPVFPMIGDGDLLMAMKKIKDLNQIIALHCENQAVIQATQKELGKRSDVSHLDHCLSRPEIAELEAIQRAVLFAKETGARLHVLHLSIPSGARVIKRFRKEVPSITVETCPHYLIFDQSIMDIQGPYAKCNPPLRSRKDVEKLWNYILDGTIDCVVSDHSPYTLGDKDRGWKDIRESPPGINGLQLGLPLMMTEGVSKRGLSLLRLAELMSITPARVFGLYPRKGSLRPGSDADLVVVDPEKVWKVTREDLFTKNKWTPFAGMMLRGKVEMTILRGRIIYKNGDFPEGPGYGKLLRRHECVP
jgi:allantoinase